MPLLLYSFEVDTGFADMALGLFRASEASAVRAFVDQAFTRAAGAPLVRGNTVRILKDAAENYPAWLDAIGAARETIHFETYAIHADAAGQRFADALAARARAGVKVRIVYDWLGAFHTGRRFWNALREAGAEVRVFNTPRLDDPAGWLTRDHRKCIVVDAEVAFVTGLCVGTMWEGNRAKGLEGWRDTGVEVRGPAVAEVARAFGEAWAACGPPLPKEEACPPPPAPAGDVAVRVVAATSGTAGLYRLDPLVAALSRRTLWLTDAYYAGTPLYMQALRAAARDGVDVRLLVPGRGSDIAVMQAISRAGYRPLLDAGVRVFEWNGPMLHAKSAVADARWARVGSTNLNLASWVGNWELDVVVEDETFGRAMEALYLEDLGNATEIILERRRRVRAVGGVQRRRPGARGTAGRAAAGALRLGNAIGSALASRRVLGAAERGILVPSGIVLATLAIMGLLWPRALAWPVAAIALWWGFALLIRAWRARPGTVS